MGLVGGKSGCRANAWLSGRAEEAKSIEEKMREERVSEREIEIAIKVTEEKLRALKGVVEKKKTTSSSSPAGTSPVELA